MQRIVFVLVGVLALAGAAGRMAAAFGQADGQAAPVYGIDGEALHRTCFGCYEPGRDRDFVFTRYSP
jgi:hypothetical protein